jgi:hypothetical protein
MEEVGDIDAFANPDQFSERNIWGNGHSSSKPEKRVTTHAMIMCNKFASISFAREEFKDAGSWCIGICKTDDVSTDTRVYQIFLCKIQNTSGAVLHTVGEFISIQSAASAADIDILAIRDIYSYSDTYSVIRHTTLQQVIGHVDETDTTLKIFISEQLVGKGLVLLLSDKSSVSIGLKEHQKRLAPAHDPALTIETFKALGKWTMNEDADNITSSAANKVIMRISSDSRINVGKVISSIGVGVCVTVRISDVA